jgi:hypothetical protein
MVSEQDTDNDWARLTDEEPDSREGTMVDRYNELAGLTEEERRTKLRAMANAEYALPDDKLRLLTVSRMRAWLSLDEATARTISSSYDVVMQQMPGDAAMRRVAMVQKLVLEFTPEEEERLRVLAPRVFAGAPSRLTGLARDEVSLQTTRGSNKAWWAFWRKT